MTYPRTPEDWWDLAERTEPKLPGYAAMFGAEWNADRFHAFVVHKRWRSAHAQLEKLWADLPDTPSIRIPPFFDLCDLCSEVEVFDGTDPDV